MKFRNNPQYVLLHAPGQLPRVVHVARCTRYALHTSFGTFKRSDGTWVVDSRFYITGR